jgi:protein-S-isoprenylcysteine O-methyltransferase Ste14
MPVNAVEKKVPSAIPDLVAGFLSVGLIVVNIVIDVDEPLWLTISSLVCFGLAVPLAALPFFHLARYGEPKPGDAFYATTRVADRGIYSLVRHPQYLGYSLLVLGFVFLDPNVLSGCLAGGALVFFYVQSIVEEKFCEKNLGSEYDAYKMRVPRMNFVLGVYRIATRLFSKT